MFTVAILAGGLATRLRPFTQTIPKSLIEVAGKPFVYHQLEYLKYQGLSSVVMCIGYLGEKIKEVVGNGSNWGIDITYSEDGPTLMGTGGSLRKALPKMGENFFILYGDSYLPISYIDVQQAYVASGKKGLMTLLRNQNQWDRSNVEYLDGRIIEYNKAVFRLEMKYIDYGLSLLHSSQLRNYPSDQPFDLADVYNKMSLAGDLAGVEVSERFYEIGSRQGINDTEEYLMYKISKGLK